MKEHDPMFRHRASSHSTAASGFKGKIYFLDGEWVGEPKGLPLQMVGNHEVETILRYSGLRSTGLAVAAFGGCRGTLPLLRFGEEVRAVGTPRQRIRVSDFSVLDKLAATRRSRTCGCVLEYT